jgi:uncharacterized protein
VIADLDQLIELQTTDTNLRRLKQSIESADAKRAEIEQEFEQHASSIREVQNRRDTLHAKRADLEKQVAENKTYLERAERNLKHAQNSKEYETAMREIDALQKAITGFETQVVETMELAEGADKEIEERAEEINTLDAKLAEALAAHEKTVAASRTEFESETKHREALFANLAPQLASVYNRLAQRSRDGIAVAEVVNGSCSACYMSLRPQMQLEVKRGDEIKTCDSCSRILFYRTPNAQSEAAG